MFASLLLIASASAYDLSGPSWAFQSDPVAESFSLNTASFPSSYSQTGIENAFLASIEIWNLESEAGLALQYGGRTSVQQYGGGNNNNNTSMYGGHTNGSALATALYSFYGNEMSDCDIEFYGSNWYGQIDWSTDPNGAGWGEQDMQHTITHELGHCLGLSHSGYDAAIMAPSNSSGTGDEKRHLHWDDAAGVQAIYGKVNVGLTATATVSGDDYTATVRNSGSGRAWYIEARLVSDDSDVRIVEGPQDLGTLKPGQSSQVSFALDIDDDCNPGDTVELRLVAEDAVGNTAVATTDLTLECGGSSVPTGDDDDDDAISGDDDDDNADLDDVFGAASDDDGEDFLFESNAACGCSSSTGSFGWLALAPALLMVRRRR